MAYEVRVVTVNEPQRWEAEHSQGGLPSQSWTYAWGLEASGIEPRLAVVKAGGARMLVPFFERDWRGTVDVATYVGLSGVSLSSPSRAPLARWREYATEQGWVAGYLQLAVDMELPPGIDDELGTSNEVFVIDLDGDMLAQSSETVRQKVRRAERLGTVAVNDRAAVADALKRLYPVAMRRLGVRTVNAFPLEALDRWVTAVDCVALGAQLGDEIEAVSLFFFAGDSAEYHLNASTESGRDLAAWLIWQAAGRLRENGVTSLNLGGGVQPGDGVYQFKERFHGRLQPLRALRQVYDPVAYTRLCRASGVPAEASDRFPAYRVREG